MRFSIFLLPIIFTYYAHADLCKKWSEPKKVGTLDTALVNEASGLVISKKFPNRFYHNNDSGDGPFFYITDLAGAGTQKVTVPGMQPLDAEDIALGPCAGGDCIFLGDLGDNKEVRPNIDLWVLSEVETFQIQAEVWKHLILKYPDAPHNAEALAVHPKTGDVYILTKEADMIERRAKPAKWFRLSANVLSNALTDSTQVLEYLGSIDFPWLNYDYGLWGQIITAMDISPDGERLIALTYENAVEIRFDLLNHGTIETRKWKEGEDYSIVRWPLLVSQQEAVTYSINGRSFYFDSEFNPDAGDQEAPIYRVDCLE